MKFPTIEEKLPAYLHPFIAKQDPSLYTPIDHASWRYIMRVARNFFKDTAYEKYLRGLEETGISTESIPLISDMDLKLREFGWRAVAVVGFIPPAVFMEFLSLGVLPIACDMRALEHLSYTPAPDIVHEAAGHAPIIADPEYADYLHAYGEIAHKVIFSKQDLNVYEAIRNLSDTKEDPKSTPKDIERAQKQLDEANAKVDFLSEAALLSRMGWWTFEYGLIGDLGNPKIYGAGLLSSIGESYHCFSSDVKKVPFSIKCIEYGYDITKPQPQLFVTPDFQTLTHALEELSLTMAYKQGGVTGLEKAKQAGTVVTVELNTKVQVSGALIDFSVFGPSKMPAFLKFEGPTQLSFLDTEIKGQGADYHKQGYSTPLGKVKTKSGKIKPLSQFSDTEIEELGSRFEFESGLLLTGKPIKTYREQDMALVITFEKAKVEFQGKVLYQPEWGPYDVVCGELVNSVFGGAADRSAYFKKTGGFTQKQHNPKTNLTEKNKDLCTLYKKVRELREFKKENDKTLLEVLAELDQKYSEDWLLRLELLEFSGFSKKEKVKADLIQLSKSNKEFSELIERGLRLCKT